MLRTPVWMSHQHYSEKKGCNFSGPEDLVLPLLSSSDLSQIFSKDVRMPLGMPISDITIPRVPKLLLIPAPCQCLPWEVAVGDDSSASVPATYMGNLSWDLDSWLKQVTSSGYCKSLGAKQYMGKLTNFSLSCHYLYVHVIFLTLSNTNFKI